MHVITHRFTSTYWASGVHALDQWDRSHFIYRITKYIKLKKGHTSDRFPISPRFHSLQFKEYQYWHYYIWLYRKVTGHIMSADSSFSECAHVHNGYRPNNNNNNNNNNKVYITHTYTIRAVSSVYQYKMQFCILNCYGVCRTKWPLSDR